MADRLARTVALVATVLLHAAAAWALGTVKTPQSQMDTQEVQVSVNLLQAQEQQIQEQPKVVQEDETPPAPVKKVKVARRVDRRVRISKRGVKKLPEEVPQQAEEEVDCSMFDESTCNPCLDDPKVCQVCCAKYAKKEIQPSSQPVQGSSQPCPDCRQEDPCTPAALHEMAASFCPKVRASIYSTLGRMRLSGVGPNDYLSSRIAVAVTSSGRLSLAAVLKSSGNSGFDSAVRKAVGKSPPVLPPARISACVVSKGCVFSVTVGARKVKSGKRVIDLKKPSSKKDDTGSSPAPAGKSGSPTRPRPVAPKSAPLPAMSPTVMGNNQGSGGQ